MSKPTNQTAGFNPGNPALPAGSLHAGVGASINRLRSDPDFAEFPGVPFEDHILNVRIQYAAMRNLRAALAVGSGEVLGLLLGSQSSQTLSIEGYEPVLLAGQNPDFAWLRAAIGRFTGGAPGLIGLFRTQLAGPPEMTRADCDVIRRHLPNLSENGGFFVVIETPRSNPWSATLFALDSTGMPAPGNSMLQFPFHENLLRKTFSNDFVPEFELQRPKEIPASTSSSLDVAKRFNGIGGDVNSSRLWMVGASCILGLAGIGFLYSMRHPFFGGTRAGAGDIASYQPLGLRVVRIGTDFEVSWDRTANAVLLASDGTLTIRDGQITKIVNLDPTQLREGRILYAPLFRELTVRLEVSDNQRRSAGESVQVLGWDTNQPSGALSADLSLPAGSAMQRAQSLAPLPAVAPTAARGGYVAGPVANQLGTNHVEPRVSPAPNLFAKQNQFPQPSAVPKAPEVKPTIAAPQNAAPQPTPVVATPVQAPARTPEPAAVRPESPAAPVSLPSAAPPVVAVAAPRPAISQPVAPQPVATQPAPSQPVATQPVAIQRAASQPVTSQPIGVTSNLQAAKLIKMVTPVYPSLARATRIQGTVRFNANIGSDGRIRKLQYIAGPSVLVSAASDAVKQWIYQPTLLDGQAIEINTNIDVAFALNSK
jgi:periplasmic protein TonB